jgi:ring-1,2-phenylacetyl-CoA epoxidase subunit PaaC
VTERAQLLLEYADDELILGWRDSEWTGIAPSLEEDVAFSSIAQNEIGHARALYELAARDLGTTADELAFDREPSEYLCHPLVVGRHLDWADTIVRHYFYETADAIRLSSLKASKDPEIAGLAAKMDREEIYHRMHAEMWMHRLLNLGEESWRAHAAAGELYPAAHGLLAEELRPKWVQQVRETTGIDLSDVEVQPREPMGELRELWEEMTMVRRSIPGATW